MPDALGPDAVVPLPPFPPDSHRATVLTSANKKKKVADTSERLHTWRVDAAGGSERVLLKYGFAFVESCEGGSEMTGHVCIPKQTSMKVCGNDMFGQAPVRTRTAGGYPAFNLQARQQVA